MTAKIKERRGVSPAGSNYETLLNAIVDFCGHAEEGKLPSATDWTEKDHGSGKRILGEVGREEELTGEVSPINYEIIALEASEISDKESPMFGPALTVREIEDVIIHAIMDKIPDRFNLGLPPKKRLVTTNHILFQIFLVKRAFQAALK